MSDISTSTAVLDARRQHLTSLAEQCCAVYDDDAQAALNGAYCPRYAMLTCEGGAGSGYADNPNLTVHDSPEAMAKAATGEAAEDPSWVPTCMVDLNTGDELSWSISVTIDAS